jgi:hypothetical protein
MKLVYTKSRCREAEFVHRFDVLGEFIPNDLAVVKNSLFIFFDQLNKSGTNFPAPAPIVVLDISESTIKINEAKLQLFITELKTYALASQVFLIIAQTDIESMHAEQKAIEQALQNQLNLLENKLNLIESVKTQIQQMKNENQDLREQLKDSDSKIKPRGFFDKLWGEQ